MYFLSFLKQNKKSILKMELKFHNDMSFVLNVLCLFACHVVSYRKGEGPVFERLCLQWLRSNNLIEFRLLKIFCSVSTLEQTGDRGLLRNFVNPSTDNSKNHKVVSREIKKNSQQAPVIQKRKFLRKPNLDKIMQSRKKYLSS